MADKNYPYSVFYITHSVFEQAMKRFNDGERNKSFTFLFNAVLFNAKYKKHVGTCITFTTKQIFQLVKDVDCGNRFSGLIALGEDMARAEENESIKGDKNFRLLQHATDKDVEIDGDVKIICEDYPTKQYFTIAKEEHHYPLEITNSEDALIELNEISKKLNVELGF